MEPISDSNAAQKAYRYKKGRGVTVIRDDLLILRTLDVCLKEKWLFDFIEDQVLDPIFDKLTGNVFI